MAEVHLTRDPGLVQLCYSTAGVMTNPPHTPEEPRYMLSDWGRLPPGRPFIVTKHLAGLGEKRSGPAPSLAAKAVTGQS